MTTPPIHPVAVLAGLATLAALSSEEGTLSGLPLRTLRKRVLGIRPDWTRAAEFLRHPNPEKLPEAPAAAWDALLEHAAYFISQGGAHEKVTPLFALERALWKGLPATVRDHVFGHVPREADLRGPTVAHFEAKSHRLFHEVKLGKSTIDLVARYTRGLFGRQFVVGLELKARYAALVRAIEQLTDFAPWLDSLFLVTTPGALLTYEAKTGSELPPNQFLGKLTGNAINLLIYNATAKTFTERTFDHDEPPLFASDPYENNPKVDATAKATLLRRLAGA